MFNANRSKLLIKLSINRLKLLQNKKTSFNNQAKREIASLLNEGKEESARIRVNLYNLMILSIFTFWSLLQKVEHVIREDFNIEAMEMMELYCELLLARFGVLEQMK